MKYTLGPAIFRRDRRARRVSSNDDMPLGHSLHSIQVRNFTSSLLSTAVTAVTVAGTKVDSPRSLMISLSQLVTACRSLSQLVRLKRSIIHSPLTTRKPTGDSVTTRPSDHVILHCMMYAPGTTRRLVRRRSKAMERERTSGSNRDSNDRLVE